LAVWRSHRQALVRLLTTLAGRDVSETLTVKIHNLHTTQTNTGIHCFAGIILTDTKARYEVYKTDFYLHNNAYLKTSPDEQKMFLVAVKLTDFGQ